MNLLLCDYTYLKTSFTKNSTISDLDNTKHSTFRNPRKHPRPLIPNFQALHIDTAASSIQELECPASLSSPLKENMMWKDTLEESFRKGWANWPQVEEGKLGSGMKYTIRMNDKVIMYTELPTPKEQFERAMEYMEDIQGMRCSSPKDIARIMAESVQKDMILVIFGSNLIERAGENLDETKRICEAIFRGEDVSPKPSADAYRQKLEAWVQAKKTEDGAQEHITRTRNEVIQHARALQYITEAVITRQEDFSEQLILDTHRILCHEVNHPKYSTPWRSYAGRYRNKVKQPFTGEMGAEVHAGVTHFTPSKRVPDAMKNLIISLNADIEQAERAKRLDPYTLAAKYSAEFVCIHPFLDGNGRLCRLILNAILLKYAGIVVPIGEHDEERREYLAIKERYSKECEGEGEFAAMVLSRAIIRLKAMKDKLFPGLKAKGTAA